MSTGAIVGIVIGAVAFIALVLVIWGISTYKGF